MLPKKGASSCQNVSSMATRGARLALPMAQHDIEIILTRQLASYLATPCFLVDPAGDLIFFNEPAEAILGRRFEETGTMPATEWASSFEPMDDDGRPISPDELPLVIAITRRRPAHRPLRIRSMDGREHRIEVTAFPVIGQNGTLLGGLAIFWEAPA